MTILVNIECDYEGENGLCNRSLNRECDSYQEIINFIGTTFNNDSFVNCRSISFYRPIEDKDSKCEKTILEIVKKYSDVWSKFEWSFKDQIREQEYKIKNLQKELTEQKDILNELGISLKEKRINEILLNIEEIKTNKQKWLELKQQFNNDTFDDIKEKLCLDT